MRGSWPDTQAQPVQTRPAVFGGSAAGQAEGKSPRVQPSGANGGAEAVPRE